MWFNVLAPIKAKLLEIVGSTLRYEILIDEDNVIYKANETNKVIGKIQLKENQILLISHDNDDFFTVYSIIDYYSSERERTIAI